MLSFLLQALLVANAAAVPVANVMTVPVAQVVRPSLKTKSPILGTLPKTIPHHNNHLRSRNAVYQSDRAGVSRTSPSGSSMNVITGTITAPALQLDPKGTGAQIVETYTGIDTSNCGGAIKAGVISVVGKVNNTLVNEHLPYLYVAPYIWFYEFPISTGDQITVQVIPTSSTSGLANIVNLSTGQKFTTGTKSTDSSFALCGGKMAEWVAYYPPQWLYQGSQVTLAKWNNINIEKAIVFNTQQDYVDALGGSDINLQKDNVVLSSANHYGESINIPRIA